MAEIEKAWADLDSKMAEIVKNQAESEKILLELEPIYEDQLEFCGTDKNCWETGTGWTFVWSYNAAWAIIMGLNFILMTIGAFWFWPRFIGTWCNCCLGCCHISGISFMLAGATNPMGRICSYNKSTVEYKGDYEWDYDGMSY